MSMEQTEDFKDKKTATRNLKRNIVALSGFDNPAFVKELNTEETTEANANSDQCAFYEKIDYSDTKATVVLTGNDNSVSSVLKLVGNGEVSVHFENDFEIYGNEGEQAAPTQFVLPRKSLTTSISSGVPTLINLEHFLQDDDDLNDTPPVTHGRPSIVAIESPLEDFPISTGIGWKFSRFMESFPVNLVTSFCILLATGTVIADVSSNSATLEISCQHDQPNCTENLFNRDVYADVDFVFSSYMLVEVICSVIAVGGFSSFVRNWRNYVDALVAISTWIFSLYDILNTDTVLSNRLKILQVIRCVRLVRLFRLFSMRKKLAGSARHLVSRNKRRYQHDGFDLDLTYVTDRIIAMSAPASGKMSLYRNPIKEVAKFLDTKHSDHYKVYNLCSEHRYNPSHFHGAVERYPIDDHNVPTVNQMLEFTASVRSWLEADPKNIIAVHCKGGKGRTGTMICVWLVEAGLFSKAEDSLCYFGARRTDTLLGHTFQGVETPSQSRYVGYYERIKNSPDLVALEKKFHLRKLRIEEMSDLGKGNGSNFRLEIYSKHRQLPLYCADFSKIAHCKATYIKTERTVECEFYHLPILQGDIQIVIKCHSRNVPKGCLNAMLYFWFHTNFITDNKLRLKREQLDNPHKPSTWRHFGPDFAIQLDFDPTASDYVTMTNDS